MCVPGGSTKCWLMHSNRNIYLQLLLSLQKLRILIIYLQLYNRGELHISYTNVEYQHYKSQINKDSTQYTWIQTNLRYNVYFICHTTITKVIALTNCPYISVMRKFWCAIQNKRQIVLSNEIVLLTKMFNLHVICAVQILQKFHWENLYASHAKWLSPVYTFKEVNHM